MHFLHFPVSNPSDVDPEKYGKHERKAIYEKIKRGFVARVRSTEKHGFGPWFPDHIPVSAEVRNLISKLLEYKVKNRYTAQEALQHEWIVKLGKMDAEAEPEVNAEAAKSMVSALAKFNNTCQLKMVVVKLFREQFETMRPQHFHQLEELFTKMDTDGDGIVSYEEFEAAVSDVKEINIAKEHIQQMFQNVNQGKDEKKGIRFADLLNALVHDYLVAADERLYAAFRALDDDDDGKITTEQLKAKLKENDPLGEWDRAIQIIEESTLDNDGVIDYEEFLLNLHPNFEESPEWLPGAFKKMTSLAPEPKEAANGHHHSQSSSQHDEKEMDTETTNLKASIAKRSSTKKKKKKRESKHSSSNSGSKKKRTSSKKKLKKAADSKE